MEYKFEKPLLKLGLNKKHEEWEAPVIPKPEHIKNKSS